MKYARKHETMEAQGMGMEAFVDRFRRPLCKGRIQASPIDKPVYRIGNRAFEVDEDGLSTWVETCDG